MKLKPNIHPLWSAVPLLGWLLLLAHAFDALMTWSCVTRKQVRP